jgi:serine/threonine protein kinase
LRRIKGLNYWPIKKVLKEKYRFNEIEAQAFADFLIPMLHWDPDKRATAQSMLDHPWLTMPANYNTKLTPAEFQMEKAQEKSTDLSEHYAGAEMSKLTDSEGEYFPADDEEDRITHDRLERFFDELSDVEQVKPHKPKKLVRDLAEGQNLNNSFGYYNPDDWEHLHVDKGMNPQFNVLRRQKA